ncbi:hypothetical protein GQ457_07G012980 [Hibiscus cannabinus]
MTSVEQDFTGLLITTDEDEGVQISIDVSDYPASLDHCFVGLFLTSSVIHFHSMRTTLANAWHPMKGISISDLGGGRFLFRWNFNSHLLILHRLTEGEDPMLVPFFHVKFWVYVHDVPLGFMSEKVARVLGDFIGFFLEYDSTTVSLGYKRIMKLQTRLDVRLPLKCRKKLMLAGGKHQYVRFEYDKLTLFCFLCGKLGHGESFCSLRFSVATQNLPLQWDASPHAPPRRAMPMPSRWLVEEKPMVNLLRWNLMQN